MKTYRVRMKYVFKDCDYTVEARDEEEALEKAKVIRDAEWEQAIDEVRYWENVPFTWENTGATNDPLP